MWTILSSPHDASERTERPMPGAHATSRTQPLCAAAGKVDIKIQMGAALCGAGEEAGGAKGWPTFQKLCAALHKHGGAAALIFTSL